VAIIWQSSAPASREAKRFFRLFGTASVGSQSLTGIARLHRLRNDPKLAAVSAVWPFETGWTAKAKWLPAHVLVLHAEIYPSVRDSLPDDIKDRGQVPRHVAVGP
jgi:hypothetical protein